MHGSDADVCARSSYKVHLFSRQVSSLRAQTYSSMIPSFQKSRISLVDPSADHDREPEPTVKVNKEKEKNTSGFRMRREDLEAWRSH